jgi:hypothetical protein
MTKYKLKVSKVKDCNFYTIQYSKYGIRWVSICFLSAIVKFPEDKIYTNYKDECEKMIDHIKNNISDQEFEKYLKEYVYLV